VIPRKKVKESESVKQVFPKGNSKCFQQGRASGSIREEQVVPTGKSK
jgi:hypothetical protein